MTLPPPAAADTFDRTVALAVDGSTDTSPRVSVTTLAAARSTAAAVTEIDEAPATPIVPDTPSMPRPVVVVPTSPLSCALVVALTSAVGLVIVTATAPSVWLEMKAFASFVATDFTTTGALGTLMSEFEPMIASVFALSLMIASAWPARTAPSPTDTASEVEVVARVP